MSQVWEGGYLAWSISYMMVDFGGCLGAMYICIMVNMIDIGSLGERSSMRWGVRICEIGRFSISSVVQIGFFFRDIDF